MNQRKVKELLSQMTLEEKVLFCVGKDFWHLQGLERLDIPSVMVTDGPHGLRKQVLAADHLGLSESNTAICFPAGCALASGFDPALGQKMGEELGKLAQAEDVSTVLGPAMNIKRSPLGGRNFEYYSEDPAVTGSIAASVIKGIQSQNVGACPKHFLANNQEYFRMSSNSVVKEYTMREIYLAAFEKAVKEARPWTMMCSYNRINGTYASENKTYLTDILRGEWGFDGYVMTDWGACNDPVESLASGLDLEMPGPGTDNVAQIIKAVQDGVLEEAIVDRAVERILTVVFHYQENRKENAVYDFEAGHEAAREIATQSAVLLKNEDAVLPLHDEEKVAIIGSYAKEPRYQGGGSSHINPYQVTGAWEFLSNRENVTWAEGFLAEGGEEQGREMLLEEALEAAKAADKAVIFAGLPDSYESEGYDRSHLDLPPNQNALIAAVAAVQPNIVVVLHNGSPVTMPWIDQVKAVLEVYLGGEAIGAATADLLYGKENPSGRLAETFPLRIEDTPTYPYYGVEKDDVVYREENLVGYRYYETMKKDVLFPFGHGLSYTNFSYSDLIMDREQMQDTDTLRVSVTVTNTGERAGREVVQLYVTPEMRGMVRPVRELKAFEKILLQPGESREITFMLGKRAFAYWNEEIHDWHVADGIYRIQICKSAADILLEKEVVVKSTALLKKKFGINTPLGDIMSHPIASKVLMQVMGAMMQKKSEDMQQAEDSGVMNQKAIDASAAAMPLRALLSFSPDAKREQLEQIVEAINHAIESE